MERRKHLFEVRRTLMTGLLMLACSLLANANDYVRTETGISFSSDSASLRIDFVTADIVRVRYTREAAFLGNGTGVCIERAQRPVRFSLESSSGSVTAKTDSLIVSIDLASWSITFRDAVNGSLLLQEAIQPRTAERIVEEEVTYDQSTRRTIVTADGQKEVMDVLRRDTIGYTWRFQNRFYFQDDEALYGLGSHMEDYLNLRGKTLYLCQHNLKAMIPVLNSTAGYGLLFDAGCSMVFSDEGVGCMELEAAKEIDYYLMKGRTMDDVVANYRLLTGGTPMMPRYLFGYIQSKERYTSSDELLSVAREYRRRQVPLDLIVQDWNYWPEGWGYIKLDPRFYPDAQALNDSLKAINVHSMISIWPNPANCPQADDFRNKGFMLKGKVWSIYDVFNPLARQYYWTYVNRELFSKGFDAWWCDCSEPLDADWGGEREGYGWNSHRERWQRNTQMLSDALGSERAALYSLYHSRGIYENQRLTSAEKRVVNLTRSSFAGQQRYATITWNGDTHATWKSFAQQIPAGLNFMATGCNYWTVDVGTFFTRKDWRWFYAGDFQDGVNDLGYREFYTRMFQWGTFLPLLRSHGTDTPREIWRFGNEGEPFYDAILKMINLRYQLLPYTYSMAGCVTRDNYTMARLLAFDFPHDKKVLDLKNEYMFGSALLVCPVTTPMYYTAKSTPITTERKREVYLPAGTRWTDFWTDETYDGGQQIQADAPIDRIPLYVRAGSLLPMSEQMQHTGEAESKDIIVHVYPGKDAQFTLYSDEGDSYRYEQGEYACITLKWDERRHRLTFGQREGQYRNMPTVQTYHVVLHKDKKIKEHTFIYTGKEVTIKF